MRIFSGSVEVSATSIFARRVRSRQFLAYQMRFSASTPVALLLPLPTAHGRATHTRFLALDDFPHFFRVLDRAFRPLDAPVMAGRLRVEQVGSYEASIVPSLEELGDLDLRFQLPPRVWTHLPRFADYSFAVFTLRPGAPIHPMALSFVTRERSRLYFPTTHIHDGKVHAVATFDHDLYAQGARLARGWSKSPRFPDVLAHDDRRNRTHGIVRPDVRVTTRRIAGTSKNGDIYIRTLD